MNRPPLNVETLPEGRPGGAAGTPPLVFVHGFGACNHFWRHWAADLARDHRVHLVELMGFGKAPTPRDGDYSPPAQARRLAELITSMDGDPPVLIGHSIGGGVVLLAALELLDAERDDGPAAPDPENAGREAKEDPDPAPTGLRGLVVISGPIFPQKLPLFLSLARMPGVGELFLLGRPPSWALRLGIRGIVHDPSTVTRDQVAGYALPLRSRERRRAILRAARQIRPEVADRVSPRYGEIGVPTLAMWGAMDRIVPPGFAERLEAVMPRARAILLPEVGHLPPEEAPERSLTILRGFLASLSAEPGHDPATTPGPGSTPS